MNRIAELRKRAKISQAALGRAIGAAQNTVCNWENGNREPDFNYLQALSDFFGVSIDYLLGREAHESSTPSPDSVKIPVLGRVVAGVPIEAVTDILDYEEIPRAMARNGDYFALKVQGGSMAPEIREGDVVIVRKQDYVDSKDVAIVLVNGRDATIKEVQLSERGIMLIGWNVSEFQPHFYTSEEVATLPVTIVGKVVELRRKF